jgi:hypothetical protein
MRCVADDRVAEGSVAGRGVEGRGVAGRGVRRYGRLAAAVLVSACLVAACSSAGSGHRGGRPGPFTHGRIVVVPGAGGGFLAVPSVGGFNGRPAVTVPPIPAADSGQSISLPLNSYADVSGLQQTVLEEAQSLLTQKCMADRGFVYNNPATPVEEQALLQTIEYGYGITSLSDATSFGYSQPVGAGSTQVGGVFIGGFSPFGELKNKSALTVALLGFAPGVRIGPHEPGCLNLADNELYRPGGSQPDPVPAIAQESNVWTQTDRRVRAVNAAWSRCMAKRGYHYTSPLQPDEHNWPKTPTKAETATAVADVTCKQQTNLANTWLTVEAAYQTALIGQNIGTLASLQASFQSALSRVETLLASPGGPGLGGLGSPNRLLPPPARKPAG